MTAPLGRWARRGAVTVAGVALLVGGAVMLVLPGPGVAAILAGLALLATEFGWAARLLAQIRQRAVQFGTPLQRWWRSRRQPEHYRPATSARP